MVVFFFLSFFFPSFFSPSYSSYFPLFLMGGGVGKVEIYRKGIKQ